MNKRLDEVMVEREMVFSRSQAQRLIKLGKVRVDNRPARKAGQHVHEQSSIEIKDNESYVSRAGFKLAGVADRFSVDFTNTIVLDVGSSTGGFTDFALQHGASKVIAVDVGTDQLHSSLRGNPKIELHEKTDIRNFTPKDPIDIVVIDVSFISLRKILPHIKRISGEQTLVMAMLKPQFEAGEKQKNKGIVKNDTMRRSIIRNFEAWVKEYFVIVDKADAEISGSKGNKERFYLLR
jgi:23S rRNA (cytidine1920-2'-O)/16S rRNA (cytidine1409-2'-O)-methyltransferase